MRVRNLLWAVFMLLGNSVMVRAQSMPFTKHRVADFVPQEWEIEQDFRADLNADKRPDAVVVLRKSAGFGYDRRLVVLLSKADGWQRIAAPAKMLGKNMAPPGFTCANGVLHIEQEWGTRFKVFQTQRFRFEPSSKRLRFIGEEREVVDREGGDGYYGAYSTNLLTGMQHVIGNGLLEARHKPVDKRTNQQRRLHLRRLYMEDVDNDEYPTADFNGLPWLPDYEKF